MLKKKLFRDLRRNLSQFFVIFLMVLLSVMVFAGVHAYMDGMRVSSEEIYGEYNLADMWLTGKGFSKDDLEKVLADENVLAADRRLTVAGGMEGAEDVTLELNFLENNEVCRMYIFDGVPFDPEDTDGMWLDKEFAAAHGLGVGDTMQISYAQYGIRGVIAGLVETPDHAYSIKDSTEIFPDHNTYGYVYLSSAAIPDEVIRDAVRQELGISADGEEEEKEGESVISSLLGGIADAVAKSTDLREQIPYPYIMVDLADPELFDETRQRLQSEVASIIAVTGRTELASYMGYQSEVEEGETYSFVFTALFLFIAVLSVITTMHRFIRKERTQIGTLKALGFRRGRIMRHYLSYNLVLSIAAALLGIVTGVFTIGAFFLDMEMEYFEMPEAHLAVLPVVYAAAALSVLVIALATWLSCRKILNEPASQALRTEVPSVRNTHFTLTTKGIFRNASTVTRWNLRDIWRNKGRSAAGIVGIMGCTMLVITATGMYDTIQSYLSWQFEKINHYQSYIVLSQDCTDEQLAAITETYGDATSQTLALEVQGEDGSVSTQTMTVSDAPENLRFTGHRKELITLGDDGVYITEKLSGTLGLDVGDSFTWHAYGDDTWHTSQICGTFRDPQNQRFACTRNYLESLGCTYRADTVYSMEELDRSSVPEGAEVIQSRKGLEEGVRSMLGRMTSVIVLFIFFAALLAVVILYNLGILSFAEKQYQFATLKVLGYRTKALRKIFNQQGRITTVIAVLLGLPAGRWMISYIFSEALGDSYDFPASIRLSSYLVSAAGILAVSILVNDLMSRKIRKIDMVSSLKANE